MFGKARTVITNILYGNSLILSIHTFYSFLIISTMVRYRQVWTKICLFVLNHSIIILCLLFQFFPLA